MECKNAGILPPFSTFCMQNKNIWNKSEFLVLVLWKASTEITFFFIQWRKKVKVWVYSVDRNAKHASCKMWLSRVYSLDLDYFKCNCSLLKTWNKIHIEIYFELIICHADNMWTDEKYISKREALGELKPPPRQFTQFFHSFQGIFLYISIYSFCFLCFSRSL